MQNNEGEQRSPDDETLDQYATVRLHAEAVMIELGRLAWRAGAVPAFVDAMQRTLAHLIAEEMAAPGTLAPDSFFAQVDEYVKVLRGMQEVREQPAGSVEMAKAFLALVRKIE
jgi:hypothetical protein